MDVKVKWLVEGKRQVDKFGAWELVEAGQISDWPRDQLHRVIEGVHYEFAESGTTQTVDDSADNSQQVDDSPEVAPTAEPAEADVNPVKMKSVKPKAKRKARRKIAKATE